VALMANTVIMGIDVDGASLRRVIAAFDRMPEAAARAMGRANRKLETWLKRVAVRAASRAVGFPQRYWMQALRFYIEPVVVNGLPVAVSVWIGTNPVPVHRLGDVRWTRRMKGARVGRELYPGMWSWGEGSKTGIAVMQRINKKMKPNWGKKGQRTGVNRQAIDRVEEYPHEAVENAIASVAQEGGKRYERLLARELRYALTVEATA
jgi:hypothetical protein